MSLVRKLSFQTKLVIVLLGVVLLVTTLGLTLVRISVNRAFSDLSQREGRAYDQWVRTLITRYPGHRDDLAGIGRFLEGSPRAPGFLLVSPEGQVVLAQDPSLVGQVLPPAEVARGTPIELPDGSQWTIVPVEESPPPPLHEAFLQTVNRSLWIATGVVAVVALILALLLIRHLTGPLRNLAAAAHRIAAGDLTARVEETGEDELGKLAQSFNAMAESLEEAERSKRQMIADVAHELRTPITVLRAAVEGFEDGVLEPTPENLSALKDKVHLTARLIEDLQQLALADMGRLSLRQEPFPLEPVIADIAAMIGPQLEDGGIQLALDLPPDLPPAAGDRQRIQQVLLNLMANALRHTPAGGEILVTARADGSEIEVSVCDTGPGISPEDAAHLFARFYRGREERAAGTGTGLGLSVAKAIVEAHGGRIWAENRPTGGACFHFTLPRALTP
ncbi:Putative Histidine kinase [Candidatus Bipolaricaulis anaerobius]|uniref:histidine kinase n=1 Tax=Candidatus Bipolaricaulis anaerobius TaxID=2026885 RepID=A0A2X3KLB4_9BACT|nr:ATP-binding protein [Candidatus Bipolaricaulis anaerobius]SQD93242.1 Putative Histidine kinase [Candidatus Bipolaricaulis anaerobius]